MLRKTMGSARARIVVTSLLAGFFGACSEPSLRVGYDDVSAGGRIAAGGGSGGPSTNAGAGSSGVAGAAACKVTRCESNKAPYACGDCIDNNDGDGLVDADDPECTGPCDDDERFFSGGLPSQSSTSCRRDCYFDRDSGAGNDRCEWSYTCDPLSQAPNYPPTGDAACAYEASASCDELGRTQSATCLDVCLPITPNGCDCFGCCELPARSGRYVWLGSTRAGAPSCDFEHVDDPTACAPCNPVLSCLNRCEDCEVCVGTNKIGSRCTGTIPLCAGTPCGRGLPPCSGNTYCITGCCVEVPL